MNYDINKHKNKDLLDLANSINIIMQIYSYFSIKFLFMQQ